MSGRCKYSAHNHLSQVNIREPTLQQSSKDRAYSRAYCSQLHVLNMGPASGDPSLQNELREDEKHAMEILEDYFTGVPRPMEWNRKYAPAFYHLNAAAANKKNVMRLNLQNERPG